MAAITSKAGVKGFKSAILQMRQLFDLYINIRPAKKLPGIGTPLAKDPDIDIVMFRENTEDLYAAVEFFPLPKEMFDLHKGMDRFREGKGDVAVSWRLNMRRRPAARRYTAATRPTSSARRTA